MLTNNQLEVMRHALGIQRGRGEFRNHFVTGPGSVDFADCEVLVSLGMMIKRSGNQLTGGDPCYHVTDSGRHAIRLARKGEAWHKGPPPSLGWWPCRGPGNYFVLRWWDGQRWSWGATRLDDALAAAWLAARPETDYMQPHIEWTKRPDWWPERSRT